MLARSLCLLFVLAGPVSWAIADPLTLHPAGQFIHLRSGGPEAAAEWDEFLNSQPVENWTTTFQWSEALGACLEIRQQDVKQSWTIQLNDKPLGTLVRDENDMVEYMPVPAGMLRPGANTLSIATRSTAIDDIRLGAIRLHPETRDQVLSSALLQVRVLDGDTQQPLPCRITILNEQGALQSIDGGDSPRLAVRPGVVYTGNGRAELHLPAGRFLIFAGRGFEYSLAQQAVTLAAGDSRELQLTIRREVATSGYVACDTHVHTLTHSGHGDCTDRERMITLAGEGIELPIATDHNRQIDYGPIQRELGLDAYFTPVTGNEVTTGVGHFNIFPAVPEGALPNHSLEDWNDIADEIERQLLTRVSILNHARDVHRGVQPFGPLLYNAAIAERYDERPIRVNAMEVLNSGATQTDPVQLASDWMQLLNRGYSIAPIGCSDSHDVARYIVGQGRTYIRCDDSDVGKIDIDAAIGGLLRGDVAVSYGLLAELTVNGKYRPGELATAPDETLQLNIRVLGPHWVTPTRLLLFCNGEEIRDVELPVQPVATGVKWEGTIELPRPKRDVHYVALALGEGTGLFWPTGKPYQPLSPHWTPRTLGCSGAVWVDADRDGLRQSAHDYAQTLVARHHPSFPHLVGELETFDIATATHAAALWHRATGALDDPVVQALLKDASPHIRNGFQRYYEALRERDIARLHAIP